MDGDQRFLLASLATLFLTALVTLTFAQSGGIGTNQGAANSTTLSIASSFAETGLPDGARWNVTFGSATIASTSGNITFVTSQGNLFFSIPDQVVNGTTYVPDKFAGYMVAGNLTWISFAPEVLTSTIASTSTSTAMTTVSLPAAKPAQVLNMSSTSGKAKGTFLLSNSRVQINTAGSVVKNLGLNLKTSGIRVNVSITNSSSLPAGYASPSSPVYQFMQINGSLSTNPNIGIDPFLSSVTYNFTVPISWVQNQDGNVSSITLLKYAPDTKEWNPLQTSLTGSNNTAYFYSAISNSFSLYAVSYLAGNAVTTTVNSLTLTNPITTYPTYFWSVAARFAGASNVVTGSGNWITDNSASVGSATTYYNVTSIGHNTIPSGKFTSATRSPATNNIVMVSLGANVLYANRQSGSPYTVNVLNANSMGMSFTVSTSNSFVILMYAASSSTALTFSTNAPGGSVANIITSTIGTSSVQVEALVISSLASGTYAANIVSSAAAAAHSALSIVAYVYPPYTVTLNDVPSSGFIDTNGVRQASGNTISVIGTATANAVGPSGYTFNSWISSSAANIIIASAASQNTFITVEGAGTLTATFNAPSAQITNPSNAFVDVNQYETVTATITDPNGPYTYDYIVSNSVSGAVVEYFTYTNSLTTNTLTFQPGAADPSNSPENVNVVVNDNGGTTFNSIDSSAYFVANALVAGAITPSSPSINSGQSVTLNAIPSGGWPVLAYVPITFTNAQSSATPAIFQAMITVNSLMYSRFINSNWFNVEFTSGPAATGFPVNAWVEQSPSNTLTNTIVWLRLTAAISGSGGTNTIYMDFMTSNVMSASGSIGEAPQWSCNNPSNTVSGCGAGQYGQYDNGANVFTNYWNFAGSTTPSTLIIVNSGQHYYQNNGIVFALTDTSASYVAVESKSTYSAPYVVDADIANIPVAGVTGNMQLFLGESTTNTINTGVLDAPYNSFSNRAAVSIPASLDYDTSGAYAGYNNALLPNPTVYNGIYSLAWTSAGTPWGQYNYTTFTNSITYTMPSSLYAFISAPGYGTWSGTLNEFMQWFRTRAVPPGGTMPSFSFGQPVATANAYIYSWYTISGTTAPTCISANLISGATSNTYLASPTTTNTYTYRVIDYASTPNTVCSAGDTVSIRTTLTATPNPYTFSNTVIDVGQMTVGNTLISNGASGTTYTGNVFIYPSASSNILNGNTINFLLAASNNALTFTVNAYSYNSLSITTNTFNPTTYWFNAIGVNTIYGTWTFNAFAMDSSSDLSPSPILTNTLVIYALPTSQLSFTNAGGNSITQGTTAVANDIVTGGSGSYSWQWTINNANAANTVVSAHQTSNTYVAPPAGSYVYNVLVTDIGTTTYYSLPLSQNVLVVSGGGGNTCYITPNVLSMSFGPVPPNSASSWNGIFYSDSAGNANAYLYIAATNWIYSSNSAFGFGVGNALWSATPGGGTAMSLVPVNSQILIPAGSSNTAYYRLLIPPAQSANIYAANIIGQVTC